MKIEINENIFSASVDGKPLNLTNKEFDILKMLVDANGKIVTYAEIEKNLYQDRYLPESPIIKVFVCKLRNKLGKENGIQTIWGRGYVLPVHG